MAPPGEKKEVLEKDLYFLLGELKAGQDALSKMIATYIARLEQLEMRMSKHDTYVAYSTGVASVVAAIIAFLANNVLRGFH